MLIGLFLGGTWVSQFAVFTRVRCCCRVNENSGLPSGWSLLSLEPSCPEPHSGDSGKEDQGLGSLQNWQSLSFLASVHQGIHKQATTALSV